MEALGRAMTKQTYKGSKWHPKFSNSLCSIHRWKFNNREVTTMKEKSLKTYAINLKNALGGKVRVEKYLTLVPHSEGSTLYVVGKPFPL